MNSNQGEIDMTSFQHERSGEFIVEEAWASATDIRDSQKPIKKSKIEEKKALIRTRRKVLRRSKKIGMTFTRMQTNGDVNIVGREVRKDVEATVRKARNLLRMAKYRYKKEPVLSERVMAYRGVGTAGREYFRKSDYRRNSGSGANSEGCTFEETRRACDLPAAEVRNEIEMPEIRIAREEEEAREGQIWHETDIDGEVGEERGLEQEMPSGEMSDGNMLRETEMTVRVIMRNSELVGRDLLGNAEIAGIEALREMGLEGRINGGDSENGEGAREYRMVEETGMNFMRVIEVVVSNIGNFMEEVGRNFLRDMEVADREMDAAEVEAARAFELVLHRARRILENRIMNIADQMLAEMNSNREDEQSQRGSSSPRQNTRNFDLGMWMLDALDAAASGGLSDAEISELPTRVYSGAVIESSPDNEASKPADAEAEQGTCDSQETCQICLGEYEKGILLRTLPCFHEFHASCVDTWLKLKNTCPSCRFQVLLPR